MVQPDSLLPASLDHLPRDPAVLAFLKFHVTSVPRWQAIWYLATHEGWHGAQTIATHAHQPEADVREALEALRGEGIVRRRYVPLKGWAYTFHDEATLVVAERLVRQAVQNSAVRHAIIACVAGHPSSLGVPASSPLDLRRFPLRRRGPERSLRARTDPLRASTH